MIINTDFPPVFVVSLARSKERRADIARHLDLLKVDYKITDAVDGQALDISSLKNRLR